MQSNSTSLIVVSDLLHHNPIAAGGFDLELLDCYRDRFFLIAGDHRAEMLGMAPNNVYAPSCHLTATAFRSGSASGAVLSKLCRTSTRPPPQLRAASE